MRAQEPEVLRDVRRREPESGAELGHVVLASVQEREDPEPRRVAHRGLRALYFLLGSAVTRFYLLKHALAVVLIFVGLKMAWLNDVYGAKSPIGLSLAIIAALIAAGIVLSLVMPPRPAWVPGRVRTRGAA